MAGGTSHPGILYCYTESIALAANGCCAFLAALANFEIISRGASTGLWFLVVGGVVQLLCALRAFRAYDHFGATALAFYAAYWALLGLEVLLSTNIGYLHVALLVGGGLLTAIAPLVNSFYPLLLGTIAAASSFELALRVAVYTGKLKIAAGISELVVVLITGYGCIAAILHGVHERQVLPGFDDAVVETVLWKRSALKSIYSDGKWANPAPLGNICFAMGLVGLVFQSHSNQHGGGVKIWLATFAVLCGLVSQLHNLRHEKIWAVSSICDSFLFAASATNMSGRDTCDMFLVFAALRLFLLWFATSEEFPLMHLATFVLQAMSLFIIGASYFVDTNSNASMVCTVAYLTAVSATYNGMAELANSVAQKELLPIGQDWRCKLPVTNSVNDEETGFLDMSTHRIRQTSKVLRLSHSDKWADRLMEYANNNSTEGDIVYPGDNKVLGSSDFQSPIFVMTIGTALYSVEMSTGVASNSSGTILNAALMLLISQSGSLVICLSRGQTSFGFLSFTFLLEGLVLLYAHFSEIDSGWQLVVILVLQVVWLSVSIRVFRILSVAMITHTFGLLFYFMSGISGDKTALRHTASAFFAITCCLNVVILGLCLGAAKSVFCRWILQSSAADTEKLCPMGSASDRAEFDKCVRILKEGGVCCIPTDTVYCLACAADRPDAIQRIYDIKSRPSEKPLSLWLGSINDIRSVSPEGKGWTPKLFAFMEAMWPGSVSLVVSRGNWLQRMGMGQAADLIGTADSIALRVPNSTLTVALLKETGPLAITSANPSGACDCTHHNKVDDVIASKIDYILADGPSPMTIASSVLDVRNIEDNELFFYRVGCVPENYIWRKLNELQSGEPPLFANVHNAKSNVIQSFLSQITVLVGCATYKLYMLVPDDGSSLCEDSDVVTIPYEDMGSRVRNSFASGLSYYNDGEVQASESSEMIIPLLNSHGRVMAVLHLLEKASDGSSTPFTKEDLRYSTLVSTLMSDNLPTYQSLDGDDWAEKTAVVTLTENGLLC